MSDEPLSKEQLALLRASYQQTMSEGSQACPDDETLVTLVLGDGERTAVADHVVACRRCTDRYRKKLTRSEHT